MFRLKALVLLARRLTLNQKILAWSLTLIIGICLILSFSLRSLIGGRIVGLIRGQLRANAAVVEQTLSVEGDSLLRECQVVTDAPKVKAAIATADEATVRNVLVTFMPILHCDFIAVTDQAGKVLGQVGTEQLASELESLHLLREATQGRSVLGYWNGHDIYRVTAQPVILGEGMMGCLLIGFAFNRDRCLYLEKITNSPVCLARDAHVLVGTLNQDMQAALERALQEHPSGSHDVRLGDQLFLLDDMPLSSRDAQGLHLVFLRSLEAYTRSLSLIQWVLGTTALITSLLAAVVSLFISRNITGPLRNLIEAITVDGGAAIQLPQVKLNSTDGDVATLENAFNHLCGALSHSLQSWEDSFNSINEALFLLDLDHRVVRSNRTAEDLASTCHETVQGLCDKVLHLKGDSGTRLIETRLPGCDQVFMRSESPLLDVDHQTIGMVLVLQDITDLHDLRQQVAEKEKLASVGQAMASVSHELSNPLQSILSHAEVLSKQVYGRQARPEVETLLHEAHRAVQVVQNMLTFAAQRKSQLELVDTHQIIHETLLLRQTELAAAGIRAELSLHAPMSWVKAEAFYLQQVFLNLLLNAEDALKDHPPPKTIHIRSRNGSQGSLYIQVEDSGNGILDSILPRLFESFFTTKPAGKGTGLGLAICRTIVQEHGGLILAGNAVSGGAIFSIWLPRATVAPAHVPVGAPTVAAAHLMHVDHAGSLAKGQVMNWRYTILKKIGQGGMGSVYLAEDQLLGGKPVALKEMHLVGNAARSKEAMLRFQKEAEILAKLDHPSLVPVSDFFVTADAAYLAMGYVEGVTLEAMLAQHTLPTVGETLEWVFEVCEVLLYLHGQQPPILMRDLKPGNIMLDTRGHIRLIDFGLARRFTVGSRTSTNFRGYLTPGYAPVEQYTGTGGTDSRSDIYALGATMYVLLTGVVPAESVSLLNGDASLEPISHLRPEVSAELEAVVMKMMALQKADRYQAVQEVVDALRRSVLTPSA